MSLTQEQLAELKHQLERKRTELLALQTEATVAGTRSDDGPIPDRSDAGTRAEEEQALLDEADRDGGLLAEVEHALSKFVTNTYGLSELSRHSIPFERLRAVPWARLTADEEERRERHRGGPR